MLGDTQNLPLHRHPLSAVIGIERTPPPPICLRFLADVAYAREGTRYSSMVGLPGIAADWEATLADPPMQRLSQRGDPWRGFAPAGREVPEFARCPSPAPELFRSPVLGYVAAGANRTCKVQARTDDRMHSLTGMKGTSCSGRPHELPFSLRGTAGLHHLAHP